jgi:hypothetical protein
MTVPVVSNDRREAIAGFICVYVPWLLWLHVGSHAALLESWDGACHQEQDMTITGRFLDAQASSDSIHDGASRFLFLLLHPNTPSL